MQCMCSKFCFVDMLIFGTTERAFRKTKRPALTLNFLARSFNWNGCDIETDKRDKIREIFFDFPFTKNNYLKKNYTTLPRTYASKWGEANRWQRAMSRWYVTLREAPADLLPPALLETLLPHPYSNDIKTKMQRKNWNTF